MQANGLVAPAAKVTGRGTPAGVPHIQSKGSDILRHIAEHSAQPFFKCTLQELLELQDCSKSERLHHLQRVMHVGLCKIIVLLQDLPLGFGSIYPMRSMIQDYVQDVRELCKVSVTDTEQFETCLAGVFKRHGGLMMQFKQSLLLFQNEIFNGFKPFGNFQSTNCADIFETVPAVRRIQRALDDFFTIRTTLRLLIAHSIQLSPQGSATKPMYELYSDEIHIPDGLRRVYCQSRHVGAICLDTRPSLILAEAYNHAYDIFLQKFGRASQMFINDVPANDYRSGNGESLPHLDTHFPYVDIHLYFVFFEILKNALLASLLKAGPDATPPAIYASLASSSSLPDENERTVKITDRGAGLSREAVRKLWSYFYSTSPDSENFQNKLPMRSRRSLDLDAIDDEFDARRLLSLDGSGLGLPVCRVLVRYFGGEIDLHSVPSKGTDVYVYL